MGTADATNVKSVEDELTETMTEKKFKKLPPCPWPDIKGSYTIHRVVMPHKLTKGGNWMGDRW